MVSVIVPIYNNVECLRKCLKSIQDQTYKNLQVICVDDGSNDGAGKVADQMAAGDSRFTVIHQNNHGESNARNMGLRMAEGDYIAFCDCDDWIEPDMYEMLLREGEKYDADITAGSWYKETENITETVKNIKDVSRGVFGRDELLRYIYERDCYQAFAYMWNKLYKKTLIFDGNLQRVFFDETLELGGDVLFLAELAVKAERAIYIDMPFYHYRIKKESGSHTNDLNRLKDWVRSYEITVGVMEKNGVGEEIINYIIRFMAYRCSNIVEEAARQNDIKTKREFQQKMKRYEEEYIKLNKDHPEWIERYIKMEEL